MKMNKSVFGILFGLIYLAPIIIFPVLAVVGDIAFVVVVFLVTSITSILQISSGNVELSRFDGIMHEFVRVSRKLPNLVTEVILVSWVLWLFAKPMSFLTLLVALAVNLGIRLILRKCQIPPLT